MEKNFLIKYHFQAPCAGAVWANTHGSNEADEASRQETDGKNRRNNTPKTKLIPVRFRLAQHPPNKTFKSAGSHHVFPP